jgi:hypothetical protein
VFGGVRRLEVLAHQPPLGAGERRNFDVALPRRSDPAGYEVVNQVVKPSRQTK